MIVGTTTVKLYASWVHSLKEKRMVVKSITTKVQNKFNVSIAEVDEQDTHQKIKAELKLKKYKISIRYKLQQINLQKKAAITAAFYNCALKKHKNYVWKK